MDICNCSQITNDNREGEWSNHICDNDFSESEVSLAKSSWILSGHGEMTDVYICTNCKQMWGASIAGHGWTNYRRLNSDYEFKAGNIT